MSKKLRYTSPKNNYERKKRKNLYSSSRTTKTFQRAAGIQLFSTSQKKANLVPEHGVFWGTLGREAGQGCTGASSSWACQQPGAATNLKSATQEVQFLPRQSWWQSNRKAKIIRSLEVYFPFLCIWKKSLWQERSFFFFLTGFMSQLKAVRTDIWCQ